MNINVSSAELLHQSNHPLAFAGSVFAHHCLSCLPLYPAPLTYACQPPHCIAQLTSHSQLLSWSTYRSLRLSAHCMPFASCLLLAFQKPVSLPAGRSLARSPMQANLSFLQAEERTATNCSAAWTSLRTFESYFPNVKVGAQLNQQYLSSRPQCLTTAKQLADSLGLSEALAFDAILLLDRLLHHRSDLFNQVSCHTCHDQARCCFHHLHHQCDVHALIWRFKHT